MKVHTMFNDIDIVLERVCAIGPVREDCPNDMLLEDYVFCVYFASMHFKPNPIWFGTRWNNQDIDGVSIFETKEQAKEKIIEYRNELIKLVSEL